MSNTGNRDAVAVTLVHATIQVFLGDQEIKNTIGLWSYSAATRMTADIEDQWLMCSSNNLCGLQHVGGN